MQIWIEFDLEDEDKSVTSCKDKDEEEIEVDVTTVQPVQSFLSRHLSKKINKLLRIFN